MHDGRAIHLKPIHNKGGGEDRDQIRGQNKQCGPQLGAFAAEKCPSQGRIAAVHHEEAEMAVQGNVYIVENDRLYLAYGAAKEMLVPVHEIVH